MKKLRGTEKKKPIDTQQFH